DAEGATPNGGNSQATGPSEGGAAGGHRQRVTASPGAIMSTYQFSRRHIGLSAEATARMLELLGVASIDELVDQAVPAGILERRELDLPAPLTEQEALEDLRRIAAKNVRMRSLIGLGHYGTITP